MNIKSLSEEELKMVSGGFHRYLYTSLTLAAPAIACFLFNMLRTAVPHPWQVRYKFPIPNVTFLQSIVLTGFVFIGGVVGKVIEYPLAKLRLLRKANCNKS